MDPTSLKEEINTEFARSGWGKLAKAIVLVSEIEAWGWADSPHVEDVAGWRGRQPTLRRWLRDNGWVKEGEIKPARPKEAFEAALRVAKKPRSSSLYLQIAQRVSLARCRDTVFLEFEDVLRKWFPTES